MTNDPKLQETLEDFRKSFFYGSRRDLNFKFLSNLTDEEAGEFFQGLLWKLGDTLNDGDMARLFSHVVEWQSWAYSKAATKWAYDSGPFTTLPKPVSQMRLALVASSGHFVKGKDPEPFGVKNMTQEEAERRIDDFLRSAPQLSVIPKDTPMEDLIVRHGGYDTRATIMDPNVTFPLERLVEISREGAIGEVAEDTYSFVGAAAQLRIINESGPQWLEIFREKEIEAVLMVPV